MMNPALMNQRFIPGVNGAQNVMPVLANGQMPAPAALSGNARGSVRMPQVPQQRINMGGEGLMRIGMAGMGASNQGPMAQFGAMGDMYGQLMDYNRAREMDEFAIREAQALEQQRRQELQAKLAREAEEDKKDESTDREKLENANEIERLESILKDLETTNLTGPFAGGIGNYIDGSGFRGEEAAKRTAKRKILSELQVNATLAFTAQTKGAITDREMALFQTPVPKLTEDETVWIEWLKPQLEVLKQLQANGITNEAAKMQGIDPTTFNNGEITFDPATGKFSDE